MFHIHAAASLTLMNRRARPDTYKSTRDYVAADFASRTMRWTGIIVGLFIMFHLMDLTWGNANPEFVRGDPYNNLVYSLQRVPVAIVYILAMIALGVPPVPRRLVAVPEPRHQQPEVQQGCAAASRRASRALILVGNLTFPIAVQLGLGRHRVPAHRPDRSVQTGVRP